MLRRGVLKSSWFTCYISSIPNISATEHFAATTHLFLHSLSATSNCQYANCAPLPAGLSRRTLAEPFDRCRPRAASKSRRANRRNRRAATAHWCLNRPAKVELLVTVAVEIINLKAVILLAGSIEPRSRAVSLEVLCLARLIEIAVLRCPQEGQNPPDAESILVVSLEGFRIGRG